jgi:PAS domain S-box-containing protein
LTFELETAKSAAFITKKRKKTKQTRSQHFKPISSSSTSSQANRQPQNTLTILTRRAFFNLLSKEDHHIELFVSYIMTSKTAKIISQTIDGASERAILIAGNGLVLHRNPAANRFLFRPDDVNAAVDSAAAAVAGKQQHCVTDFMVLPQGIPVDGDWKSIEHCRIVMANGETTRTERYIHWVQYENDNSNDNDIVKGEESEDAAGASEDDAGIQASSSCYWTAFICSKHERVREIVDHAFDPVLTANEHGIIKTVNEAAIQLFGYTEQELVGQNLHKICGGGHAAHHAAYIQNYMKTGVKHAIGQKREVLGRKKDGSEFPCELGVQEIKDVSTGQRFYCGFFKDLTQLKQHQAAIQERQALMQGMINASFDSMLEIDQDGIIQIVNDSACHMFGYTRQEFVGSNVSIICGNGHADRHDMYMQRYLETGQKHIIGIKRQVKARRKDGSELEVELGVQEVDLTNGKKSFCGFIRDLTAQKMDKRALRKQQQLIHGKFFAQDGEDGEEEGEAKCPFSH